MENFAYGEINERNFTNPNPEPNKTMHDQIVCVIPGLRCTPNSILMWVMMVG